MNVCLEISEDFIQFATAYQEGNWKFPLDASSRWSGNYQMLDIVRKVFLTLSLCEREHTRMCVSIMADLT